MTTNLEDAPTYNPTIPRSSEPHPIHQRIAEMVGALDEFRTLVNYTRLKFGESQTTLDRLDHAIDRLKDAENSIYNARMCVVRQAR